MFLHKIRFDIDQIGPQNGAKRANIVFKNSRNFVCGTYAFASAWEEVPQIILPCVIHTVCMLLFHFVTSFLIAEDPEKRLQRGKSQWRAWVLLAWLFSASKRFYCHSHHLACKVFTIDFGHQDLPSSSHFSSPRILDSMWFAIWTDAEGNTLSADCQYLNYKIDALCLTFGGENYLRPCAFCWPFTYHK